MKRFLTIFIILFALGVCQSHAQYPCIVIRYPVADVDIRRDEPTINFCTYSYLRAGDPTGTDEFEMFLRFNLSGLYDYYNKLDSAKLYLRRFTAETFNPYACGPTGLSGGENWDECAVTWDQNHGYNCENDASAVQSRTFGEWHAYDLKDLVFQWLSRGYINDGVAVTYKHPTFIAYYSTNSTTDKSYWPYIRLRFNFSDQSTCGTVGVESSTNLPDKILLQQNYPNPFNPSTRISYSLPRTTALSIKVYDLLGREVATLFEGSQQPGSYTAEWKTENTRGGVYFYRLTTRDFSETKKLILVK